jgi:hypothetical protein
MTRLVHARALSGVARPTYTGPVDDGLMMDGRPANEKQELTDCPLDISFFCSKELQKPFVCSTSLASGKTDG